MTETNMKFIKDTISKIDIYLYIKAILAFLLGAGIADYLAINLNKNLVIFGFVLLVFLLLTMTIVKAYLYLEKDPIGSKFKRSSMHEWYLLAILAVCLVVILSMLIFIAHTQRISLSSWIFLLMCVFLSLLLGMNHKFRKVKKFKNIFEGLFICILIPAFSLSLSMPDLPAILVFLTMPLLFIYLGTSIALEFECYAVEIKMDKANLLTALGWQKAIFLHHFFILFGFLLVAVIPLFGFSWSLSWPLLLMTPIGIFEIFLLHQMSLGVKPQWNLIRITANFLIFFIMYILLFALWIN